MMFSYSLEADAKEREEHAFLMFSDYIEEVQKGQLCICSFVIIWWLPWVGTVVFISLESCFCIV